MNKETTITTDEMVLSVALLLPEWLRDNKMLKRACLFVKQRDFFQKARNAHQKSHYQKVPLSIITLLYKNVGLITAEQF
ncbi:hypothetical protein HY486_02690 [Candidatus Woesearchaeota archaeon]|nr:hypothetical protein [Candidatus Woesearchaeota archaeon]